MFWKRLSEAVLLKWISSVYYKSFIKNILHACLLACHCVINYSINM